LAAGLIINNGNGEITMAELISVSLTDGSDEIINLDYVLRIRPVDRETSQIVLLHHDEKGIVASGTPAQIAGARRFIAPYE
jgi:hypothetical protein